MRPVDILTTRIRAESVRFEASVAGAPFLPGDADLRTYCEALFTEHCRDIDGLVDARAHHYCWMAVATSEIGLEFSNGVYTPRASVSREGARPRAEGRLGLLVRQLSDGYFQSGLTPQPVGVTVDWRAFEYPLAVSSYLVLSDGQAGDGDGPFRCRTFLVESNQDTGGLAAWLADSAEFHGIEFESHHVIQPVRGVTEDVLGLLTLLTMQFQREWGNKNKLLERRLNEIAGVSHDLCHQLYDALRLVRMATADQAGAKALLPLIDGILVSMFGVPWRHRAFRDGSGSGMIRWASVPPVARDAHFWDLVFQVQASRVLRASSLTGGVRLQAVYSFRSGSLQVETTKTLPEGDIAMELRFRRMLEERLPFVPWPLSTAQPGLMQFEGEKAMILTAFSELLRNATAVLAECATPASSDLRLEVTLDPEGRAFLGRVDTNLPAGTRMPGAAQRVAWRLSRTIPGLSVQLSDDGSGWASFAWKLDLNPAIIGDS